jgi:streptogramin lyase
MTSRDAAATELPQSPLASMHEWKIETRLAFDAARGELPESITMDESGNLFLSMGTSIGRVTPAGEFSRYATLPLASGSFALGVKVGPDGALYVASGAFTAAPPQAFVWRIPARGAVEKFATLDARGFPNDLLFDADGSLYVTDPFLGRIYRIGSTGQAELWLSHRALMGNAAQPALAVHEFGIDGLAFSDQDELFVGNLDAGAVLHIPRRKDGSAGSPEVFVQNPLLEGADGLAFDRNGTLFVAVNAQDRLVSIDPTGNLSVVAEGAPLDAPSSLVFGRRPGDERTLYVASFAINRATGGSVGAPQPALLALATEQPGLSLLQARKR